MNFVLPLLFLLVSMYVSDAALPGDPESTPPSVETAAKLILSHDNGESWMDLSAGLPEEVQPLSVWPGKTGVYVGTSDGLYHSGMTSTSPVWKKDLLREESIIGIFPGKEGHYVINPWGGLFQYHKATGMWNTLHPVMNYAQINTVLESSDSKLFAGGESGLFVSSDKGRSWLKSLDQPFVRKLIESEGVLFACSNYALMRSTDDGKTWNKALVNPGTTPFNIVRIQEGQGLVAMIEGQSFAGIRMPNENYRSTDNGLSWELMTGSLPKTARGIYDLKGSGQYLFACSMEGIFRSGDQGISWKRIRNAPGNKNEFYKLEVSGNTLVAILISGC